MMSRKLEDQGRAGLVGVKCDVQVLLTSSEAGWRALCE